MKLADLPPPEVRHVGRLIVYVRHYPRNGAIWYFRTAHPLGDLGSWVHATGSVRCGKDMRKSRDEAEVVGWFLDLIGEPAETPHGSGRDQ